MLSNIFKKINTLHFSFNSDIILSVQKNDGNGSGGKTNWAEMNRSFGLLFNIGYYVAASVGVGLFLGYHIDKYFKTDPVFTLLLTFLGVGAGLFEIIKIAMKSGKTKS